VPAISHHTVLRRALHRRHDRDCLAQRNHSRERDGERVQRCRQNRRPVVPTATRFMPDNRHVLFTSFSATPAIIVGDLRTGSSSVLAEQVLDPTYVAPGTLLFGRLFAEGQARVWARRFDANRLKLSGDAVPVTGGVRTAGAVFAYAASDGASLAYLPGRGDNTVSRRYGRRRTRPSRKGNAAASAGRCAGSWSRALPTDMAPSS
jgi:hypothetical protein